MTKAYVKNIPEGTEAEYIDLENKEVCGITFQESDTKFIGHVYEFERDESTNELWRFYPKSNGRYEGDRIESYLHESWLLFLEPVQGRMI
jgi:hypothetical protein